MERISERPEVFDELTVYASSAWRADFAAAFFSRVFETLDDAARRTGDPVVPAHVRVFCAPECGEPGTLQPLLSLAFETVELEVAFLDATMPSAAAAAAQNTRADVAALLGADIKSAIVIMLSRRSTDAECEESVVESHRADALAIALAAAFARRRQCVAFDAAGAPFSGEELIDLALQRRGKSASWTARVTAALARALQEVT